MPFPFLFPFLDSPYCVSVFPVLPCLPVPIPVPQTTVHVLCVCVCVCVCVCMFFLCVRISPGSLSGCHPFFPGTSLLLVPAVRCFMTQLVEQLFLLKSGLLQNRTIITIHVITALVTKMLTLLMHLLLAGPFKVPHRHHLIHCGPPSEEDIALLSDLED